MGKYWSPPVEHPISIEKAKKLLAGKLGDYYRKILIRCCVPIYWFPLDKENPTILHNGTVTLLETPQKIIGVTASHVLDFYKIDRKEQKVRLQLMNEVVDNLLDRVIDNSDRLDIATFDIDREPTYLNFLWWHRCPHLCSEQVENLFHQEYWITRADTFHT